MGGQESKCDSSPVGRNSPGSPNNGSRPSTPILTPLDPRSPSVNIARTPLELVLGRKPGTISTEINGIMENVVLGIDPRSPTAEFNRTPIIIPTVAKENGAEVNNKNFDNVRKTLIQTTLVNSAKKANPRLVDCSPVAAIPNIHKRKSLVGLLETNLDFTETDLDSVYQAKKEMSQSLEIGEEAEQLNKIIDSESGIVETAAQIINKEQNTVESENEKTPEEKTINITAQVKDFDKKLTNLIYQDESGDETKISLKLTKVKDNNRTPLGVRNANEETKKTSKLRVSDKPRKSEGSKIPVFKDKNKKMDFQCENTPPAAMEEKRIKPRKTHWDGDKTLII